MPLTVLRSGVATCSFKAGSAVVPPQRPSGERLQTKALLASSVAVKQTPCIPEATPADGNRHTAIETQLAFSRSCCVSGGGCSVSRGKWQTALTRAAFPPWPGHAMVCTAPGGGNEASWGWKLSVEYVGFQMGTAEATEGFSGGCP